MENSIIKNSYDQSQPDTIKSTCGIIVGGTIVALVIAGLVMWACKSASGFSIERLQHADWKVVGTARLADVSKLNPLTLPLEETSTNGSYRYRLSLPDGSKLYLTGGHQARSGEGRYLLGNQPIPPAYGGLYVLQLAENFPSGFRLPGWTNVGFAADVYVNGKVGPYKHILQCRLHRLNTSKYSYRVVDTNGPVPAYTPLIGDLKLSDGDIVRPKLYLRPYKTPIVAYKIMLSAPLMQ